MSDQVDVRVRDRGDVRGKDRGDVRVRDRSDVRVRDLGYSYVRVPAVYACLYVLLRASGCNPAGGGADAKIDENCLHCDVSVSMLEETHAIGISPPKHRTCRHLASSR